MLTTVLKTLKLIIFLYFYGVTALADAAYYATLPKGVRNFTYRLIKTNTITGSYNSAGEFEAYNLNANINADVLIGINSTVDTFLNGLSQADYDAFSFGTFEGEATSKVTTQAIGGGWGITNKLTIYGFVPYYNAVVDLNLKRTEKGRNNVGTSIVLEGLPDIDVRIIQNLFVNYYHYQPLGKWEASGLGDIELGAMWNFKSWKKSGLLGVMGVVAPTGKDDNPDILQDINFGDGQWDAFFEFGGGVRPITLLSFDSWLRYTYQFGHTKVVRLPDSEAFPITARKGEAKINLGNKVLGNLQVNLHLTPQWTPSLTYSLEHKSSDEYKSAFAVSDSILEKDTSYTSQSLRFNLNYSTVSLYKKKLFLAPLDINAAVQTIFAGNNTPKYERFDFELRLYF